MSILASRRLLALLLPLLSLLPGRQASPDPEAAPAGRTQYMGRTIAHTMHWSGAEWLLRESRESEEGSELVRRALGLRAGQVVCDLGCGNGYYSLPMARAVGPAGKVYAVDIQEEMLALLAARAAEAELANIELVRGTLRDPKLPARSCDLIVMIDVYHELSHPVSVLAALRRALKPGGHLVLFEFRAEDASVPIKALHKMSKAQVLTEMAANGFRFESEFDGLPWQHMQTFQLAEERARVGAGARSSEDETVAPSAPVAPGEPDEPDEPDEGGAASANSLAVGTAVAQGFWRALLAGDTGSLSGFLAPELRLAAGSRWSQALAGQESGTSAGAEQVLERALLLRRLEALIAEVGREPWGAALTDLGAARVVPGPRDSAPRTLSWVVGGAAGSPCWSLREEPEGRWFVIAQTRAD